MSDPSATSLTPESTSGFDRLFGMEWLEMDRDIARAQVVVGPQHLQRVGLVHGGLYAAIAESLTSIATWQAVGDDGKIVMGLSNATSFLRPITSGTVHATARSLHGGRTTWVWDVEFTDDAGRRCAITRMTIAVRDRPASA